jgi:hypothetical protein
MGKFVPTGSYSKTSKNIKSTLYDSSQKRNQSWIPAGLDLTALAEANIENLDGFLVNQAGSASGNGYVPGGSYTQTSKGEVVILSADCQKRDQSWQYSTLDITHLAAGKTLSNIDGVLTVD